MITRNQRGAIDQAQDVQQKFEQFMKDEIKPLVKAITDRGRSAREILGQCVKEGAKCASDAKTYELALQDLDRGYSGVADEQFDFEGKLRDLQNRHRKTAEDEISKKYEQQFEKMVKTAKGEDNGDGFIMEDDDNGDEGIINTKCPVSGVLIKDLVDPVEDHQGIVYEKSAILSFLGDATRPCPEAMRKHSLNKSNLKPSSKAIRVKKKALAAKNRENNNTHVIISP